MKNSNLLWLVAIAGGLYLLKQHQTPIRATPVVANTPNGARQGVLVSDRAGTGVLVSDRTGHGVLVSDRIKNGVLVSD